MKLAIKHQDSYSRGDLLLRTFFGWLYIVIPNLFVMVFVSIYAQIIAIIAQWIVLFTGKYPKDWFDYQVKFMYWGARLNAVLMNMVDDKVEIGTNGKSDKVSLSFDYPASLSRGKVLLRWFLGWAMVIPHAFCLYFRFLVTSLFMGIAWWVVLLTGNYPASMHEFNVGTYRWIYRLQAYFMVMSDDFPPYSGKE
jgi:hypothetical protein